MNDNNCNYINSAINERKQINFTLSFISMDSSIPCMKWKHCYYYAIIPECFVCIDVELDVIINL